MTHREPAVQHQLDALSARPQWPVSTAVGAYLHGSAASGHLQGQSDLDVLLVTAEPLADGERAALTTLLRDLSGTYPRKPEAPRPIELTVVTQRAVRPWRYPPQCDLLYGEWLRADVEAGKALVPFTRPDLAIVITMALRADAALFGPPAGDILEHVPTAHVVRAAVDGVPQLLDDLATDTTNVLLTLGRVWRTCATGDLVSKDTAAAWAVMRSDPATAELLGHARRVYLGEEQPDWPARTQNIQQVADRLSQRIQQAVRAR